MRFASFLVAACCLLGACRAMGPASAYGAPVDTAAAVPLARALSERAPAATSVVVVSGRIGEVCSSGCWFALQDSAGERDYSVLVDLKPAASFTVPLSVRGRRALVKGRLLGPSGEPRLEAVGLRLE